MLLDSRGSWIYDLDAKNCQSLAYVDEVVGQVAGGGSPSPAGIPVRGRN